MTTSFKWKEIILNDIYAVSRHCAEILIKLYWSHAMNVTGKTQAEAVPWLRRLAAGLPPGRPGFDPGPVHVGFVVDKVALGQVFPRVLRFSPVNFIPPVLHY
jgi:hypothetical protein